MIGHRYYAIFPLASLRELVSQFGIGADAIYPELIEKENSCRDLITRDEELKLVQQTYAKVFVNRLLEDLRETDRVELAMLLDPKKFDNFWTMEVFEYNCENFHDLVADSRQYPGSQIDQPHA